MRSGIAPLGIYVGTTFLGWEEIDSYLIINDEISTIEVRVYANQKQYALRCSKEERLQIEQFFADNKVKAKRRENENETFD